MTPSATRIYLDTKNGPNDERAVVANGSGTSWPHLGPASANFRCCALDPATAGRLSE